MVECCYMCKCNGKIVNHLLQHSILAFGAGASIPVGENELQIGSGHNILQLSWDCYCLACVQLRVHELNIVLA